MRTNVKSAYAYGPPVFTHEGAPAKRINPELQLRRSVLACLLWEDGFYEDGKSIGERISELAAEVKPDVVAKLAIEARHEQHLRHAPLLLLKALVKHGRGDLVASTIERVIARADELSEFVALYWDGKNRKMIPAQMKKGLARAFGKFNEYALQKYNREAAVKLRDVLFLIHAKPKDDEHASLWKRLIAGELATPDTWEVELSAGKDKRESFERLIREGKLGYLALLRNLRGMADAGVNERLVRDAILARKGGADKVLPFRYVAAARAAPRFEPEIDAALCEAVANAEPLPGRTVVLVDVSGSMDAKLSGKSDMSRLDAAAALASVINGDLRVFSFSSDLVEVPPRRGMAGVDAVLRSQPHASTMLGLAVSKLNTWMLPKDRLIVITDEQSHDRVPDPACKSAWMINVASNKNGVGYGRWRHIDGWSEHVIRFIAASEADDAR
jgi:60 kDa SS-A/Ro ribonucleoprotein